MKKKEQDQEGDKFARSIKNLEQALRFEDKAEQDPFYFAGISKSFEICLEYAWKSMKKRITDEGIEAYSPKEVIKQAGRLGLIDNVEQWLDFLEDRNLAVHDYLGVSEADYLKTINDFLQEVKKLTL